MLSPVPPSMQSEVLSVLILEVHSAFNDIDGGTDKYYIVFSYKKYLLKLVQGRREGGARWGLCLPEFVCLTLCTTATVLYN